MRRLLTGSHSGRHVALAAVALLGLVFVFCLADGCHAEAGCLDMLHGACGGALVVSSFTAGLVLVSMNWWLLPSLGVAPYAVSLHLPDPPPKSPALV